MVSAGRVPEGRKAIAGRPEGIFQIAGRQLPEGRKAIAGRPEGNCRKVAGRPEGMPEGAW